jgi:hypothetical protein
MNVIKKSSVAKAEGADIDVSKLVIEQNKNPGPLKSPNELVFGRNFTGSYVPPSHKKLRLTYIARPHALC